MAYSAVGWKDTHWVSLRDMMKAARKGVATADYLGMQTVDSWVVLWVGSTVCALVAMRGGLTDNARVDTWAAQTV